MTAHFFPEESERLTEERKSRLRAVFSKESEMMRRRPTSNFAGGEGGQLTPATVEQLLGEHEKVDDFLEALEWLAAEKTESDSGGGEHEELA